MFALILFITQKKRIYKSCKEGTVQRLHVAMHSKLNSDFFAMVRQTQAQCGMWKWKKREKLIFRVRRWREPESSEKCSKMSAEVLKKQENKDILEYIVELDFNWKNELIM